MKDMTIPLYSRISLNRDFPEYNLKQGDIATFIDTVPDPTGIEEGYVLEIFNALGESIDVVTVPRSAVSALNKDEILAVRSFTQTDSRLNSLQPNEQAYRYLITYQDQKNKGRKLLVKRKVRLRKRTRP